MHNEVGTCAEILPKFVTEIEELKKMSEKVLNGCQETRRVILQQTNAHLNYSAAAISCGSFTNCTFNFHCK